jgi:hypothetical protein
MTPLEIRWQLPSHVAGDLDSTVEVDAALAADAGLRSERDRIAELRRVARTALRRKAPPIARRVSRPTGAWGALLGLAAAAAVLVALRAMAPVPDEVALVDVARAVGPQAPGFVATRDPGALMGALMQGGIGPNLAMVGDLKALGMELEGGMIAPGSRAGTIVFYRTPDGVLWQCHMYEELGRGGVPVEERVVRGVRMRAFTHGTMSWVVWEENGLVCVLAAEVAPEVALAALTAKIEASQG